jgi:uncharacterized protein DUF5107
MSGGPQHLTIDGVPIIRLESGLLRADVAPTIGGRVVSLVEKTTGYDFLWRNQNLYLRALPADSEYDPNFYGGIDELLPNDIPEKINGIDCPDHGELWTATLSWRYDHERLVLEGRLAKCGLTYQREMSLRSDTPCLDFKYRLSNPTPQPRDFLWKLHAALVVRPDDIIDCPARKAQVVDLAWSRYKTLAPFHWPKLEGSPVNVVPAPDGTMDFFYLYDLAAGEIAWRRPDRNLRFAYTFDQKVFPYAWLFASYGGFNGHYTIILEPCTAMPISVNQAALKQQCSRLEPGQILETSVSIHAGIGKN